MAIDAEEVVESTRKFIRGDGPMPAECRLLDEEHDFPLACGRHTEHRCANDQPPELVDVLDEAEDCVIESWHALDQSKIFLILQPITHEGKQEH